MLLIPLERKTKVKKILNEIPVIVSKDWQWGTSIFNRMINLKKKKKVPLEITINDWVKKERMRDRQWTSKT